VSFLGAWIFIFFDVVVDDCFVDSFEVDIELVLVELVIVVIEVKGVLE